MIPIQSKAAILVLGDAMLDIYISGKVDRISPEAPVAVLLSGGGAEVMGGAANVAANIARLGVSAHLISLIGEDLEGSQMRDLAEAAGLTFHPIVVSERSTTSKTRVMAGAHQLLRIDREKSEPISPDVEEEILARLEALLPDVAVLVLSDYAKGMLSDRVVTSAIASANAAAVPVLIDPKRRDFTIYTGATLIKPNRSELAIATGRSCGNLDEVEAAAQSVIALTGAALLVTLSENGMAYFAAGRESVHMPTQAKSVFDVSGAGDTTLATVACCIASGLQIEQTMRWANLAAGLVVSKLGTATVSLDELRDAAGEQELPSGFAKRTLASLGEATAIREHWRCEGLIVGFTNGCFDLMHPGHIALLRGAAKTCDRLIVALNSDASTARLKGPTRPIQNEISRATVVGAIHCVDLVVLFEANTPLELIKALKPDVLIKGADYSEEQIVGADVVKAAGGRVERVPLIEGQSSTALIRRGAGQQ